MIPSPKDRFLADAALSKRHADMVGTSDFADAMDKAMLEYSAQCARSNSPSKAGLLLQGAHEFARVFCDLSVPRMKTATKDPDNL